MHKTDNTLKGILTGCIKGDKDAQNELYHLYFNDMMKICLRYAGDRDQAKDIFQDSFIKVFNSIETLSNPSVFDSWIRRIFVNTALDYLRKEKREVLLQDKFFSEVGAEKIHIQLQTPKFEVEGLEESEQVLNAIQELTPAYRATLNLYIFENLTHKEIAEKMGITVGSSKSNLAKARARLQELLKKKEIYGAA
ncbi:MAG: RNA polymerase sigma factor [Luteibaculaceae bacterium]